MKLKSIFTPIASLISELIVNYCLSDPIKGECRTMFGHSFYDYYYYCYCYYYGDGQCQVLILYVFNSIYSADKIRVPFENDA